MLRARHLCCALLVVSCACQSSSDDSSKPDKPDKPAGDPWSASAKAGDKDKKQDKDDDDSGVPFDPKSGLSKIAESISKPGPYEAPEKSKGFDAGKPHWGVLRIDGAVVEREALSLTGGRGLELRALIDRLRELASDDKLTGVMLRVGAIQISLPDAAELRAALHDVRKAGK